MKLLDEITIAHTSGPRSIRLYEGDLAAISERERVDILVVSAFYRNYTPTWTSLIGALDRVGLSVGSLACDKAVDLTGISACWLSQPVARFLPPGQGMGFDRILCFEPMVRGAAPEVIGDIFRSLVPVLDVPSSVAMPLVAAGSQAYDVDEMLPPLIEAAAHWMGIGLPLHTLKIVEKDKHKAREMARLFADMKRRVGVGASPFYYDAFISYCHADKQAADFVAVEMMHLKPGVRLFVDRQVLDPGHAWQQRIFDALDDCRRIVALYSPAYLASKVSQDEWNIAYIRHNNEGHRVLFPIYLRDIPKMPTYLKMTQYINCREADEAKLRDACKRFVADL